MDFPSSPSVFYIDDDHDDDRIQYFGGSRTFNHQGSSSCEIINRTDKKRKLTNHHHHHPHQTPSIPMNAHGHGSKRPRHQPFDQGRVERPHSMQSGTEFEPILVDPEEYVIEEPETHSFHAFDWTLEPRRPTRPIEPVPIRKPPHVPRIIPAPIPIQPINMIDTRTTMNLTRNSIDRNETRRRSSPTEPPPPPPQQQTQRKLLPIPVALPPAGGMPLPLPKPTATLQRTPSKRGRPAKIVHTSRPLASSPPTLVPRPTVEPAIPSSSTSTSTRPIAAVIPTHHSHSEIRRQTLNGTGIFSAFHDTKYYRCNICKFKSVTSSTLLQHLFTHLFFCHHCSYYTFSNYQLAQHLFDKHQVNFLEDLSQPSNPTSFDLLYLTRCGDGTFALCMDASSSTSPPIQTQTTETSRPSSSMFNQSKSIPTKKRKISLTTDDSSTVNIAVEPQLSSESLPEGRIEKIEKIEKKFVLMKSRTSYSLRKPMSLQSLILEYELCRRETLEKKFHYSKIDQRKLTERTDQPRRLIEEIAHCLRTVVNQIVEEDEERINVHSSLLFPLPEQVLCSIFPTDDLKQLTDALKLTPKSKRIDENSPKNLLENHIFVLGLSETIQDEKFILSSLHSNATNGEIICSQTKLPKLPLTCDNTSQFLQNFNDKTQRNRVHSKKITPKSKTPPTQPLAATTVMSNSTINLSSSTNRVDRNNNAINTSQSNNNGSIDSPLLIVLD